MSDTDERARILALEKRSEYLERKVREMEELLVAAEQQLVAVAAR